MPHCGSGFGILAASKNQPSAIRLITYMGELTKRVRGKK